MSDSVHKPIGSIFVIGFVSGAIFSYSGMLSFVAGFATGAIFTHSYRIAGEDFYSMGRIWIKNILSNIK